MDRLQRLIDRDIVEVGVTPALEDLQLILYAHRDVIAARDDDERQARIDERDRLLRTVAIDHGVVSMGGTCWHCGRAHAEHNVVREVPLTLQCVAGVHSVTVTLSIKEDEQCE